MDAIWDDRDGADGAWRSGSSSGAENGVCSCFCGSYGTASSTRRCKRSWWRPTRNWCAERSAFRPAQVAMALLLQAALGVPDHEVVELTVMDRRWQMVLGCLGAEEPLFSQGTLFNFRQRMIAKGLDQELFDKTVALARETGGFSATYLRAAFDASPLWGAGRVGGRHLQSHRACCDARRSHGRRAIGPIVRRGRCRSGNSRGGCDEHQDRGWTSTGTILTPGKRAYRSSSGRCRPSVAGSIVSSRSS